MSERPAEIERGIERSSSFARSFFLAGQDSGDLNDYGSGGGGGGGAVPAVASAGGGGRRPGLSEEHHASNGVPEQAGYGGMRRQRSRRRMSTRNSRSGSDAQLMAAAAAAAAAVSYEEGEPTHNLPHMSDPNDLDRKSSWYTDALLQGGGTEDLSAILGHVQDNAIAVPPEDTRADDDEVLEQYRIMAHVEANIRVKDNTGFDMIEYEKRRKLQPEPTKADYYSGNKKPKPKLPEPRLVGGSVGDAMPKAEEPPLPTPRQNRRFVEQRTPRVPELCPGVVVRGQVHVPEGEHVVRCLGCKAPLRVNMLATLVNCPDCSTVSPASSTRR